MPAPGWLLLWRSVYIANGRLQADGIRIPWSGAPRVFEGNSADAITLDDLPINAKNNPETLRRFNILNWFADRLIAPINGNKNAVGDMRITAAVESLTPLWGLQFDPATGQASAWRPPVAVVLDFRSLFRSLIFDDPRYKTIFELNSSSGK